MEAIRRPPKLGIDIKVAEIKDAIFQVTCEGHVQLLSRYEGMRSNIFPTD